MLVILTYCKLSMLLNIVISYEVKDLGVFVDGHLTFHSHIDKIFARAFIRSSIVLKCFVSLDFSTFMRAFTVDVRPYW